MRSDRHSGTKPFRVHFVHSAGEPVPLPFRVVAESPNAAREAAKAAHPDRAIRKINIDLWDEE